MRNARHQADRLLHGAVRPQQQTENPAGQRQHDGGGEQPTHCGPPETDPSAPAPAAMGSAERIESGSTVSKR